MTTEQETKHAIEAALNGFDKGNLAANARALFATLGYASERRIDLEPNTADTFAQTFDPDDRMNREAVQLARWRSVDLLLQLTTDEIINAGQSRFQFGDNQVDNMRMESYLFFAIELDGEVFTRTELATITREINRLFPMPVMVLFRHGPTLTLSLINRRLNKLNESRDVLEKVTLIKDIVVAGPHRAHIEILYDLSLASVLAEYGAANFVELHRAWQQVLDASALNKRFFQEVANWYFWAVRNVTFPKDAGPDEDVRNATGVIRLITRLIFVWFLKEKGLVPDALFNERTVRTLLVSTAAQESTYYKAILQNLFFATLNQEMNTAQKRDNRKFRGEGGQHYNITSLYRYKALLQDPEAVLQLFENIPFLNGGLFECLDKPDRDDPKRPLRVDGFSDRPDNELKVPNVLFFGDERSVDLNTSYGTRNKHYKVRGLLEIFGHYKFTINENTPIEEEIALDPELLGQVFENLLAAYNPETEETARKQTGSFYTPREVVNYMVDEALIAHFKHTLGDTTEPRLRQLFAYSEEAHQFDSTEVTRLIAAIDAIKMLDPAVGSGAFPMGILHKLVFILDKLDPHNRLWKEQQIARANQVLDVDARERAIETIEEAFERNELDYGRKLYLIENCIYGVDIQPVAVQIAKLRFFISLIVDQKIENQRPNRGIRPLPNLETKFVAANTLLSLDRPAQLALRDPALDRKEQELAEVRRSHFTARRPPTKAKYRDRDREIRAEIRDLLVQSGFPGQTAAMLARWDPYDQNISAGFFDPAWMFGVDHGFDVVISNPPYVRQEKIKEFKPVFATEYECYTGIADLYVYFYERGVKLLKPHGILTYISSNKYFRAGYGAKLRGYLGAKTTVDQVIDFGDAQVFTAIAYPSIILLRNAEPNGHQTRAWTWQPGPPVAEFAAMFAANHLLIAQKELAADGWRLESPAVLRLLDKLRRTGKPLGDYVNQRFYYGIKTGFNEAFVVDRATRDRLIAEHPSSAEVLKPFLRGRDVKRWRVQPADLYLIKLESSENKQHPWSKKSNKEAERIFAQTHPAIHARFEGYRNSLVKRSDQGKYFWELRSCDYWKEFEGPKIILGIFMNQATFAFDREAYFHNNALHMIAGADEYVVAVVNSSAAWWFLTQICTDLQNGYLQAYRENLIQIPVPNALPEQQTLIIKIVEQILVAKRANPAADVAALEAEIDALVYELYGLTPEEIAIVEQGTRRPGGVSEAETVVDSEDA